MKNIKSIVIIAIFISLIVFVFLSISSVQKMVVVQEGNIKKQPLEIKLGHFQDSDCGMVIDDIKYASQAIAPDGKTWFFHDEGGMIHWLKDKKNKKDFVLWVWAIDVNRWIKAQNAWYSLKEITPMGYGFGAYTTQQDGFVDFNTMSYRMLRGETLNNPYIKRQLLGKY